jgi:hypothetical protein
MCYFTTEKIDTLLALTSLEIMRTADMIKKAYTAGNVNTHSDLCDFKLQLESIREELNAAKNHNPHLPVRIVRAVQQ